MIIDRVKERLEQQMKHVYAGYDGIYFYVLGFTKKGKKVFWGPENEDRAYQDLATLKDGEVFKLKTRDPRRAVREVRDLLIKRGVEPDEALRKLLHGREEEVKGEGIVSKLFKGRFRPKKAQKRISRNKKSEEEGN